MLPKKLEHPKEKLELHPRNKHRERYDFKKLIESCPELENYVKPNNYNDESIDFFDPNAVKMLNKALLQYFYGIKNWDIPQNYLCPPIPGRADYIHHIADLLFCNNINKNIKCLDIGTGANCVYPIIGSKEYGWSFVGTDIDTVSIASANRIIDSNPFLKEKVEIRLQNNPNDIFKGIIFEGERFEITICNPPFHASSKEAKKASVQKLQNLKQKKITKPTLNFGGQCNELWCEGGEEIFVENIIIQSKQFSTSCFWFSTLVSKQSHLTNIYKILQKVNVIEVKTIMMRQGNKTSRIVAWTFLTKEQQMNWNKLSFTIND